jgi:hypothetical protein
MDHVVAAYCARGSVHPHRVHIPVRPLHAESDTRPEPVVKLRKKMEKARDKQYRELAERIERQGKLDTATRLLQTERLLQVRDEFLFPPLRSLYTALRASIFAACRS